MECKVLKNNILTQNRLDLSESKADVQADETIKMSSVNSSRKGAAFETQHIK